MERYTPCKFCSVPIRFEITAEGKETMPISVRTGKPHWAECEDEQVKRRKAAQKRKRKGLTAAEYKRFMIDQHKPDLPGQLKLFKDGRKSNR